MQLLYESKPLASNKIYKVNMSLEASAHYHDMDQKRSSNASLLTMNPVASGDNMTVTLNSAHKLKEEFPPLVPCCEGKELLINEDLVRSGLSAISVKHEVIIQSLSLSCANEKTSQNLVKHRNSFRCLHRPDLKRVPYLRRLTPDELEMLFRGFSDIPNHLVKSEEMKVQNTAETNNETNDFRRITAMGRSDGIQLHPIPETKSGAQDIPIGMRLHCTKGKLYTSVLAGTKTGDQLDNETIEDEDFKTTEDIVPEDEIQLNEELQIILPPRCDDCITDSSINNSINN